MNTEFNVINAFNNDYSSIIEANLNWNGMNVPEDIPQGDMPGDKVWIGEEITNKANILFPQFLRELKTALDENKYHRAVVAVSGGSGVGKTCIASLFTYYLNQIGIKSYTLSGDNYPKRIPEYNDAERLHIYREAGIKGIVDAGLYNKENFEYINNLQVDDKDTIKTYRTNDVFKAYNDAGRKALAAYLGSENEIRFDDIDAVLAAFKNGADKLWLKRMGRTETSLWYEEKDFSDVQVIIIEWTHGNSNNLKNTDIPILLNSTPEETLEYRKSRNRDGNTDTPFIQMVLELEQKMLHSQAHKAKIILSKSGDILSFEEYSALMNPKFED